MSLGRRDFKKHEGPIGVGPAHVVRTIEKHRSQWIVIERAYNSADYVWLGGSVPANTLQNKCVLGSYKTKSKAIAAEAGF